MLSNPNATAIAKKYYCGSKGSIGLNDGRRRRRRRKRRGRKKPVPRAAAGYARQLKIGFVSTIVLIMVFFKSGIMIEIKKLLHHRHI